MNFLECTELMNQWLTIILILGLSEEMYEDEYQNIVNIDISFTVIKQMQELYKDKYPNMPFK